MRQETKAEAAGYLYLELLATKDRFQKTQNITEAYARIKVLRRRARSGNGGLLSRQATQVAAREQVSA